MGNGLFQSMGFIPLEQRPEVVDTRKRIGDVEVDLMIGSNHKSALLVMTDRATTSHYD
jgi:IS30 family transposase